MAEWKGLDTVLAEISKKSPGARLEDVLWGGKEGEAELRKTRERRILPVERWLDTVRKDIDRAPDPQALGVIVGPHYFWDYDELGRVIVATKDFGQVVPMFVEVWAGEPE